MFSVSESRKAQSATVNAPYDDTEHPLAKVQRRTLNATNHFGGFALSFEGQEPLQVIQYEDPSAHDGDFQEYKHHCDGACDGSPHQLRGRVATMLIYCEV